MDSDLVARAVNSVELEEEMEFEPGTSLGLFPAIKDYLRHNKQNTYDEAVEVLERYIGYYNDVRVHPEIGCPPQMALAGEIELLRKGRIKELDELPEGNYSIFVPVTRK